MRAAADANSKSQLPHVPPAERAALDAGGQNLVLRCVAIKPGVLIYDRAVFLPFVDGWAAPHAHVSVHETRQGGGHSRDTERGAPQYSNAVGVRAMGMADDDFIGKRLDFAFGTVDQLRGVADALATAVVDSVEALVPSTCDVLSALYPSESCSVGGRVHNAAAVVRGTPDASGRRETARVERSRVEPRARRARRVGGRRPAAVATLRIVSPRSPAPPSLASPQRAARARRGRRPSCRPA